MLGWVAVIRLILAWLLCTMGALCMALGWIAIPVVFDMSWWWAPVIFMVGLALFIAHMWVDDTQ